MKNKSTFITLFILIIVVLFVFFISQKSREKKVVQIKNIQDKVQLIDSEKGYQVKILNNEQFLDQMTDGGGQLIGYLKDGKVVKIVEQLGLSYAVKTYRYYFSEDQLILVYEKDENFPYNETTQALNYTKLELAFEGRYFFEKEKLIDTQTTGTKRFSEGDNTNIEEFFLKIAKENIGLLTK
ncbi:MAG: hypothetical protein WC781_05855 [Candidatus Pacearchaeota archaeon]|jgi:hypothetical protein